jgi:hypothetical protein
MPVGQQPLVFIGRSYATTTDTYPTAERKEQKTTMRGLFQAYIIDSADDEVICQSKPFVAKDEENARLKAVQQAELPGDLDDYDIIIERLGDVRAKQKIQEVRVVKE